MSTTTMTVRPCRSGDEVAISEIYNHYIAHTTITFEEAPLSPDAMGERIRHHLAHHPWLVCESGEGQLLGYAYGSRWRERAAYRHTAEVSVYVRDGCAGRGVGKALYRELIRRLTHGGCHVALGCIALPNEASVALHEHFGFEKVAHFPEVGRKFDRWLDVGYWQLTLRT